MDTKMYRCILCGESVGCANIASHSSDCISCDPNKTYFKRKNRNSFLWRFSLSLLYLRNVLMFFTVYTLS